jgi:hypothetical protein
MMKINKNIRDILIQKNQKIHTDFCLELGYKISMDLMIATAPKVMAQDLFPNAELFD